MKKLIEIGALCFVVVFCLAFKAEAQWEQLFNGKDLDGWSVQCKAQDREKKFWTVEDGAIVADSIGSKGHKYVWLVSDREFSNFELRLKFQAYPGSGNSGLQFRSRYDPDLDPGGWMNGPQVDIHPDKSSSWRTGLIYDETQGVRRWVFPSLPDSGIGREHKPEKYIFKYFDDGDGWNDLTLVCDGMHVKTIVNGVVRTDWDASGVLDSQSHKKHNVGTRGHFAFQIHSGDQVKMRFKDITIKELP